jgi:hypothetical protein
MDGDSAFGSDEDVEGRGVRVCRRMEGEVAGVRSMGKMIGVKLDIVAGGGSKQRMSVDSWLLFVACYVIKCPGPA